MEVKIPHQKWGWLNINYWYIINYNDYLFNFKVALEYSKKYTTNVVRVLTLDKNRGKGGAIRMVRISLVIAC